MVHLFARQALLPTGWAENVSVEILSDGRLGAVTADAVPPPAAHTVGILLPSPVNVHSHAFQRAMAGLTERRGPDPQDSFWTWRNLMFRFLDRLTPDHVEAIAAYVQMEMLEAGYATSVEFHYLHHQPGGQPYDNLAEMAERIIAAGVQSGIGLTLLPVHYQFGGCDGRALGPGQIRFGNDIARYAELLVRCEGALGQLPLDRQVGVAPHSLRAVPRDSLPELAALARGRPVHMHLAEQIAEVEEVQAAWGRRPVEWLLENVEVSADWCLIHCTQMLAHETTGLAATGAVAGLCPITEASLGDGIFDGVRWLCAEGRIAVGSDSNVRIALAEELRTLEYSQRLRDHSRAALATREMSTGRRLFDAIVRGGVQAAGRDSGRIAGAAWADLMVLDDTAVDLEGRRGDTILDSYVFAGSDCMVTDVWSAGRHVVQDGRHIDRERLVERYRGVLRALGDAL
ncbi:MAG: formimidoylglutamate deiminase [Hyphomicrobiaceae bacterium]